MNEADELQTPDSAPKPNSSTEQPAVPVSPAIAEPAEVQSVGAPVTGSVVPSPSVVADLGQQVAELQQQKQALQKEIAELKAAHAKTLQAQVAETQATLGRLMQTGLSDLEQRQQTLKIAVEQLERRQERIRAEMRTTFAGTSQDLAIRVQGFKDYLAGSLQDLVNAVEQLPLLPDVEDATPEAPMAAATPEESAPATPQFAEQAFQDQGKQIRILLDRYRNTPDYYGPPWQLRRTFEPVHAERVANWFFTQGGRGALRSMGSRLQNILITSAVISILRKIYGNRLRTLILANTPERLGEWRRGLQDCLGITRSDFGPERGIILFEAPEPVIQKADRLLKQEMLPLVIIDESEDMVNLGLLQFPLWLAFAMDPQAPRYL